MFFARSAVASSLSTSADGLTLDADAELPRVPMELDGVMVAEHVGVGGSGDGATRCVRRELDEELRARRGMRLHGCGQFSRKSYVTRVTALTAAPTEQNRY